MKQIRWILTACWFVTFTNAAAAEMRERVGAAIENALEQDPYNQHLQRQLTLVHNAQITTIDSFCIRILRDHFTKLIWNRDFALRMKEN